MFKEGDILIGNEKNNYSITNCDTPVIVEKTGSIALVVRVLEGENKGFRTSVLADRFDYYTEPKLPSINLMEVFGF